MLCGSSLARSVGSWSLMATVLLLPSLSCDRAPRRQHVSGQIHFDGKPVPAGEIYFDPDVTKGHDGPQGFARIENGRYDTRGFGKSLLPGKHVVRILGFDGKPAPEQPFGRALFPEYTTAIDVADLDGVTLDFKVPASAKKKQ